VAQPVANTALYEWDGKLWALWEAHRPFVLVSIEFERDSKPYEIL